MNRIILKLTFLISLVGVVATASAQTNGSNSPYSRYGYGLLADGAQGFNKGMAGLSLGMRNAQQLNYKNPASYSAIDSLTLLFDVGATMQIAHFEGENSSMNVNNTAIDHVMAGFRLAPNLGMSVGLVPFSTIGYHLTDNSTITQATGEVQQTEIYKGDGGLHEVFVGLGYAPVKNLSIGANLGYLWGTMEHSVSATFNSTSVSSRQRKYSADIRSYKLDFGVQYEQSINRYNTLVLGATYGLGHDINRRAEYYDLRVTSGQGSVGDTLVARNAFAMPHSFGFGAVWNHRNRLRVGVDYSLQLWEDCKSPQLEANNHYAVRTGSYQNRHQITLGGEYVRDANGLKFGHRVRYRFGLSYASPYAKIDGVDGPKSYMASLGVGLPISNFWSKSTVLNISAQYERVEPKFATMITENYFRLCLGLTFNDGWFAKWKVQ
ncbi:MAG: hypothetical protein II200_00625 [Bacteroidaceae bacterium]|nr:hypothetical protein [Bacteroidaceae bacterium]